MVFKTSRNRFYLRVTFLFFTLYLASYLLVMRDFHYMIFLVPLIMYQLYGLIKMQERTRNEIEQFVKASHYRDFTNHFDVEHAPAELQSVRRSLNEINRTFRTISREKETQYQYLQKILELVNTGIISYELETNEVVWMNNSLKELLQVSYLKSMKSLEQKDPHLHDFIRKLPSGTTEVTTIHLEKGPFKALLSATCFQTEGKKYKLIAFQNVEATLDETESRAWRKLLSVMTHEIMNSVAPISSLADTLKNRLEETLAKGVSSEDFEDLEAGFSTIKRRSEGLLKFAETYRNLNKITRLNLKEVKIEDLFSNLLRLMKPTMDQKNIQLIIDLKDSDLSLQGDNNLLEQVLINLLVNGIEATKERPDALIILAGYVSSDHKTVIKVSDNGTGIPEEVQDKVFVPFFSTKKSGSGIGLSLCKQIVMMHRGSIQFTSQEGIGTSFFLRFG